MPLVSLFIKHNTAPKRNVFGFAAGLTRAATHATPFHVSLLLMLLVLAAYWQTSRCDFILFDDDVIVQSNQPIRAGLNLRTLTWAFTTTYHDYWHPIPWITHIIDYQLYGLVPGGHHLTSVCFHMAAVLALFLWLYKASARIWPSALAAALFAIHPIHVESVAWISERKDVTCALFWNLTLLAYVIYVKKRRPIYYFTAILLYAIALMSKPMAMTLPFVMLLLDWWPLQRYLQNCNSSGHAPDEKPVGFALNTRTMRQALKLIAGKIPFFALAAASIIYTYTTYDSKGNLSHNLPFDYRLAYASFSYLLYIGKLLWPSGLSVLYPLPPDPPSAASTISAASVIIGLSCFAIYSMRQHPSFSVGWLWFAGVIFPVSSIIHTGYQLYADRFMYLPAIGLYMLFAWAIARLWKIQHHWRICIITVCLAMIAVLTLKTNIQVSHWKDSRTLFRHCLRVTERNAPLENNLGCLYHTPATLDSAMYYYRRAQVSNPRHCKSLYNIAMVHAMQNIPDSSAAYFRHAIDCDSLYSAARIGLAASYLEIGYDSAAEAILHEATRINPSDWMVHEAYGSFLYHHNRPDEALSAFQEALRLNPIRIQPCRMAGASSFASGHFRQAVIYLKAVTMLDTSAQIFSELAMAYHGLGITDSAIIALKHARQLAPDSIGQAIALARFLCEMGEFSEAVCEYHTALCLSPGLDALREELHDVLDKVTDFDTTRCSCPEALENRARQKAVIDPASEILPVGIFSESGLPCLTCPDRFRFTKPER